MVMVTSSWRSCGCCCSVYLMSSGEFTLKTAKYGTYSYTYKVSQSVGSTPAACLLVFLLPSLPPSLSDLPLAPCLSACPLHTGLHVHDEPALRPDLPALRLLLDLGGRYDHSSHHSHPRPTPPPRTHTSSGGL